MKKNLFLCLLVMLLSLAYQSTNYAQSTPHIYKLPASLVQRLSMETAQRRRGDCEQKKPELFSQNFYALPQNTLLILFGLPDYFCSSGSFLPVTIDPKGQWLAGEVIESYPTALAIDATQQFWLLSHWEIEGVFPLLHHSHDGVHWQEISLPKPTGIDCCFQWIKQICLTAPQIQLQFVGIDDTQQEYWATTRADSLKVAPNWQKQTDSAVQTLPQCQNSNLTGGDWQRQTSPNGAEIWFQSASLHLKIIVPHWLK